MTTETWKKGLYSGFHTTWILGKVIFPITLIVTILKYTPVISWISWLFSPLMRFIGLPGEAAIVLALGNILNLYAAIAAILTMSLTVKQVFILSVMLSFSHNLLVETAVAKRIGVSAWAMIGIRLGLAFLSAILIQWFWPGGQEIAKYGLVPSQDIAPSGWGEILIKGLETSVFGIIQLAAIVIPLMLGIQVLKDIQFIDIMATKLQPLTKMLGVHQTGSITLLAGLLFGLAYGAGVIIQSAKESNFTKKDLYLLSIFLVACHAVIEDTLLFVPLGINVLPLLLLRLGVALIITLITAKVWTRLTLVRQLNKGGHVT
ncbi:hypothetical protein L1765_11370 [Microaerobacter geothermalis]|uniref:nucleoside recognition domain-containing protein n=1 Tax=Microaerobacter geothermalis TaxID=674972 RepID=UPI001F2A7EC8|nr:nucleoside recognition domain-containing protein [Microaerobacter geothermalis]MCF6094563.1 hypothetical protein [Microaerobacter geothermalis]